MKRIILLLVVLADMVIGSDYRWNLEFDACDTFQLIWFKDGILVDTVVNIDSTAKGGLITAYDTIINVDSIPTGLHQITARYHYYGETAWMSAFDTYDNRAVTINGDKSYTLSGYAIDTSGADDSIPHIPVSIYDASGTWTGTYITGSDGSFTFEVDSGSYTLKSPTAGGYWWGNVAVLVDAADTAFDLEGYSFASIVPASPAVQYVTAYISIGTGIVDTSGSMKARSKLEVYVNLVGEAYMYIDSSWLLAPQQYKEKTNDSGMVTFRLPANSMIYPAGSYYELTYRGYGGTSLSLGEPIKFTLDTIPDPINILNATRVQ